MQQGRRPQYEDSVESEMARLQAELNIGGVIRENRHFDTGNSYGLGPPSPLAQALAAQMPNRHYIPRPTSTQNKEVDIFGTESRKPAVYSKPDSPNKELRVQKRLQQEEYARQLSEAASKQPVGNLKRNVYLTGDSLLDSIGSKPFPVIGSPLKPVNYDQEGQTARMQKRAAQQKYAEQIYMDSVAKPIEREGGGPHSRTRQQFAPDDSPQRPSNRGAEVDNSKRDMQRTYREQLDRDLQQRSTAPDREYFNPHLRKESSGPSVMDRLSQSSNEGRNKRDQQLEYARQIQEAQKAAPIREEYQLPRSRLPARDDTDDNKYTAFKRDANFTQGGKMMSPNYSRQQPQYQDEDPYPSNMSYGGPAAPALNYPREDPYTRAYPGPASYQQRDDPYGAPSHQGYAGPTGPAPSYGQQQQYEDEYYYRQSQAPAADSYSSKYDYPEEQPYNRFSAQGEEPPVASYVAPSRRVQDFKERQKLYSEVEEDYVSRERHSAPVVSNYEVDRSTRLTAREEEWKRKKQQQEAYAREISQSATAAPIVAPRVSLLRNELEINGGAGYRIRGTSTGGGVSNIVFG